MTTYATMTKIELECSMLKAEHHLRWCLNNKAAHEFSVRMGDTTDMTATLKWYDDQIESVTKQIASLKQLIANKE